MALATVPSRRNSNFFSFRFRPQSSARWRYGYVQTEPQLFLPVPSTLRPLDGATVETDIRQYIREHPNKHVTFYNNFSVGPRDWGWALKSLTQLAGRYIPAVYDCGSTTGCRDAIDDYIFFTGPPQTPPPHPTTSLGPDGK